MAKKTGDTAGTSKTYFYKRSRKNKCSSILELPTETGRRNEKGPLYNRYGQREKLL